MSTWDPRVNYSYRTPFWYYLSEYWFPLLLIAFVLGLVGLVVYAEATREYYRAPVEACQRQATGHTQVQTQCMMVGKNPCVPNTIVLREFEYTCAWRSME